MCLILLKLELHLSQKGAFNIANNQTLIIIGFSCYD